MQPRKKKRIIAVPRALMMSTGPGWVRSILLTVAVAAAAAATADGAENEPPACEEARCAEGWPAGSFELREGEAEAEAEAEAAAEFEDGELLVRMDPRV